MSQDQYGYGRDERGPYSTPEGRPYGGPPNVHVGPPRKKPRRRWALIVVSICVGAIIGVVSCTAAMFNGSLAAPDDTRPVISPPASQPGPAVPQPRKPVEKAPARVPADGVRFVGKDVAPGTYTTTVPADSIGCYWARLKDTDGELESVIANHVASAGTQASITVKATDYAIEVRCDGATWKRR